MALPQIFSRRKRAADGVQNDVYTYDKIPPKVRVQIVQIIIEGLGRYNEYDSNAAFWSMIVESIRKEIGRFHLTDGYQPIGIEFANWLLNEPDMPSFLDGVELALRAIKAYKNRYGGNFMETQEELNARLQEAGIGYEFLSGNIIQIDKQIIHQEIVLPALNLLHDQRFAGANKEYLSAHEFFRNRDYESCLIECGKSFESVLKVIGTKRKWGVTPNDTASKLVAAAFNSGFVPPYMQGQFTALRAVLESGVPTVRNRMSGHGSGAQVRRVDKHLAAYQLHQTAAVIVFLVEHDIATP